MKRFMATLYRSCNVLVIVALLLGVAPPAQNVSSPTFEPPVAHAQEEATPSPEEGLGDPDEADASPDAASGQLQASEMVEPDVVSPDDLSDYTVALANTMGASDEPGPSTDGASDGLLATKMVEPEVASPGDLVTYVIVLTNTTKTAMEGLVVSDPLPDGLAYVPHSAEGGEYDPHTRTFTWDIKELAAGSSLSLTFQARVRGDVLDDLVVNLAEVTGKGLADPVQAKATVAVVSQAVITPQEGGVLVSPSGRVRVEFPAGAVTQSVEASYHSLDVRRLPPGQAGLALQCELTARPANAEASDLPITQFQEPLRLTVDLTGLVDEATMEEYQRLFVGYLDEANGCWVHLPLVGQQEGPMLTVEVEHFSILGSGVDGDPMTGFQPNFIPSVTNAQPALFTGDATYALPLYVPPAAGGLEPGLTLRYSSGDISEAWLIAKKSEWERSHLSQPGWLGQGWSLNFGVIVRDMKGQELKNAQWNTHAYWLNMNSASGKLVEASDGTYYPEFAPQWRLYWARGGNHRNGTWYAYGPDGTKYTFGASDSERMQVIKWDGCSPEYATMRWYLSNIEDTSGNTVTFTYDTKTRNVKYGECEVESYDRAVYPLRIEYGPSNRERIKFEISPEDTRADVNPNWKPETAPQFSYHTEMLDKIVIEVDDRGSGSFETVQTYEFEYYDTSWGDDPEWLTLKQVRTVGRDDSGLPTMTFTYQNAGTYGLGEGHRNRKVLTEIDNGYGGRVTFGYEWQYVGWCYKDPCGHVRRFRAIERKAYDGIHDPASVQRSWYDYYDPTGHQGWGQFWGHAQVVETVYDGSTEVARTITEFHQKIGDNQLDPRRGLSKKVTQQEKSGSSWVELRRVESTWGFAGLPERSDDVWQVMLVASNTFRNDSLRDRTLYLEDIYGNPRAQLSYGQYAGTASGDEGTSLADFPKNEFFDTNLNDWNTSGSTEVSISYEAGQAKVSEDGTNGYGVLWQQGNGVLVSGKKYYITAWVRAEPGTTGEAQLYAHNGSSNWHGTAWEVPDDEAWLLLQLEYTADGTGNIRIHLAANFAGSKTGTIYWDNVTIAEADTTGNDERTSYWQYYPNTSDWIVNKVAQATVYSGIKAKDDDGESKAAQARYHYDMNGSVPRDWDDPPTEGLLTQEDHWVEGDPPNDVWAETGYRYDGYGNVTQVIDPRSNTTTTYYDPDFHAFPVCTVNAKGHETETCYYGVRGSSNPNCSSGNGSSMTSTGAYFGQVESVTDPNEVETKYRYDVFGRLTKVIQPGDDDAHPTLLYAYYDDNLEPTVPFMRGTWQKRDPNAIPWSTGGTWSREFFDGLGQLIQVQTPYQDWDGGAAGQHDVVRFITYDHQGLKASESVAYLKDAYVYDPNCNGTGRTCNPYVDPNLNQPQTHYSYDALGRVLIQTNPDDTQIEHHYGIADGMTYDDVIDPNRHRVQYRYDVFGRLGRVDEISGDCGSYWGYDCGGQHTTVWAVYATTNYTYDVLDNLTEVTDAASNVTTMTYDALGRKTEMTDPDMGAWSYDYDAAGNLTSQTDAKNQTIAFTYDALNRLTLKDLPTGTDVHYYYDEAIYGQSKGKRTRMTDGSGWTKYYYNDARGRLTKEEKAISGGGTFVTQWSYYANDQVWTMTYPGGNGGQTGEPVTNTYNPMGLVKSVAGANTYVGDTTYNALGQVELRKLGSTSGVLTTDYIYRTDNFRLQWIKTGPSSPYEGLQKLEYVYDAVGNVQTIKDYKVTGGTQTQSFTYDFLDRVLSATVTGGSSGQGQYSESYEYSGNGGKIGNLTFKTGVGGAGNYLYDAPVSGCSAGTPSTKPHAVRQAGSYTFTYDCNGNLVQRNVGSSYTLTYDAENQLTSVSGGTSASFVYDGDGNRVKATFGGSTIAYVGDYFEWKGSTSTMVKYYYAGGQRIAMRVGSTTRYYLLTDHLGSTAITANSSGGKYSELRYKAWGGTRYTSGTSPTAYKFTGQRLDESTGLMYYGARYYDPALGRFVQADTIVPEPGNPQDLNRYSYVRNNPLRYTDPFGYFSEEAIKDYLQRTYGDQWEDIYSAWMANEAWWGMLSEAQPGDILVMTGDQEQDSYGLILGDVAGQGTEDDVLWGIAPTQGIPRAFDGFEVGELQDIGAWVDGKVKGLARFEAGRELVRYWTLELRWTGTFLNLPAVYRPEVGQTLHPWSWYMIGLLWAEAGAAMGVGIEIIGAAPAVGPWAPLVVAVGLVPTGFGVWLGAHAWNLSMTPKSGWNGH